MRLVLLVLLAGLVGCAARQKPTPWYDVKGASDAKASRQTAQGTLLGFVEPQGTMAWLGVRYAQPPVGPLRWKAPRPPASWQGTREATRYGGLCPQLNGMLAGGVTEADVAGSEDCLTLNVVTPPFTPEQAAQEKRPVMVWIHGGGNTIGTANVYGLMRNLALRYGVVMVSVNYRLGVLGWFHHPALVDASASPEDNSGNYGTLDLIEGLTWVSANIAAFGGDPSNVTVFGESAGGFNVFSLLASPLARGLFHRAISQSGMPGSVELSAAKGFIDEDGPEKGVEGSSGEVLIAQLLADGKAADRAQAKQRLESMSAADVAAYLRGRTPEQLLTPFMAGAPGFGMYRAPALLRDGHVLPTGTVLEALAQRPPVPVLLGTNRDEFKLFMLGNPKYVSRFLGLHVRDQAVYDRDAKYVSELWRAVGSDAPAKALKQAGAPAFAYRFDWDEEPAYFLANLEKLLGAAHGLEIGFVFDDEAGEFDPFRVNSKDNEAGRVALARAISSYWVQFARTGNPGRGVDGTLPEWSDFGDGQVLLLDSAAGGGVRMERGVVTVDEIEQRLWNEPTMDEKTRCESARQMFRTFVNTGAAMTPERMARIEARCPVR